MAGAATDPPLSTYQAGADDGIARADPLCPAFIRFPSLFTLSGNPEERRESAHRVGGLATNGHENAPRA